jgi:hypothetical protein
LCAERHGLIVLVFILVAIVVLVLEVLLADTEHDIPAEQE